jgi:NhaP-type Na+/H+ or K+/H+ antiporter
MQAETLRLTLFVFLIAMYVIAMTYLRRRRLPLSAYAMWGIFALGLPALGPFLVIALRPGSPAPRGSFPPRTPLPSHKEDSV